MSRCRMPASDLHWGRGLPSISVLFAYCVCLSARGILVTESVREQEVNGIVGQSALLSGSLCTPIPGSELRVEWYLYPGKTPLVRLIRSQCSPYPDKPGYNCSDREPVITASHIGRIDLYRDNGSLLLRDLRSSDSGVYMILVYCGGNDRVKVNVTLTVHNVTEKANSNFRTTTGQPMQTSNYRRPFHLYRAVLIFLVIILFATSLWLSMIRKQMGCKSDATEKTDHSNGASQEDLDEVPVCEMD